MATKKGSREVNDEIVGIPALYGIQATSGPLEKPSEQDRSNRGMTRDSGRELAQTFVPSGPRERISDGFSRMSGFDG